jgi:hypothetical protein
LLALHLLLDWLLRLERHQEKEKWNDHRLIDTPCLGTVLQLLQRCGQTKECPKNVHI